MLNTLNFAKKYKSEGFSVIPLIPKGKKPAITSWTEYQNRIATDDELEKWFGNGSKYNIGIVTGKISKIDVLDFDSQEAIQYAKNHKFPETPAVKTYKGLHYYYAHKDGVRNFQKRDALPGIDLRGDGGYIVAPPSLHPSGHHYQWVDGKGLDDIPYGELPEVVLARKPQDKIHLKELYKGVQKGNRNDSLVRLVGSWLNDGLTFEDCVENANIWNNKNTPPLYEKEIIGVIRSIQKKHENKNFTINTLETWQDPIPFDDYSRLPAFPSHVLPMIGREMVEATADVNQVDLGLSGGIYLAVLSTCLGGKVEVDLQTHKESVNLYVCPVLDSGERKSSTMKRMTKPIYDYQTEKRKALSASVTEKANANKIREARLAHLQKKAATCDNGIGRDEIQRQAARIVREIEENPVSNLPVYIVDNITTEALGDEMANNNERMSMISAEADIFTIMAGLYNEKGANLDIYLKAHAGDYWSNHRIGRKDKFMESPCLTMCLTVQHRIIKEIGENKQFRGRGLLARFLYAYCKSKIGYRPRQNKTIPDAVLRSYTNHIYNLMDIPLENQVLTLSPEASTSWDEFYNDIENDMKPGNPMEGIKDWGSKLPGEVLRIAGLLHVAEHDREAINLPISINIINDSCAIGAYFREHALAIFGLMGEDPWIQSAKTVLDYIKHIKPDKFKRSDILRHKNVFKTVKDVMPGLEVLIERNFIRELKSESVGNRRPERGRPESTMYEVNPKIKNT